MNIEEFREHCMAVKGATESLPFLGHNVLVFKVMDKMFCMAPVEPKDGIFHADLKCDPERSVELRERYWGIGPGHVKSAPMWNRITLDSDVPDKLIVELIGHAVDEVIKKLPKAKQQQYRELFKGGKDDTSLKPLSLMTNEELWQLFPVELKEYDPQWPLEYEREMGVVSDVVGQSDIYRISHIGSTAVPGLLAKPTIDILLEIEQMTDIDKLIRSLCDAGYIHSHQPGKPAPHMMFMKGYTPQGFEGQVFHLHVRYPGDWDELCFRDYLRAHPEVAREYGRLKQRLAPQYRNDRDGYTAAKGDFIKEHTATARRETGIRYIVK